MKFSLHTWYKRQDSQGNAIGCVKFRLETANMDFRNRIIAAIEGALPVPKPDPEQKPSAMGFSMEDHG